MPTLKIEPRDPLPGLKAGRASRAWLLRVALPALLALLAFAGCEQSSQRAVCAVVLERHGTVSVQPDRSSPELPLTSNASLAAGAIVRTENGARASIALLPNALVQLTENTKLEILGLTLAKNGNETQNLMQDRFAQVQLWRGAIFLSHERNDTARAELRVATSQGDAMTGASALCKLEADNDHARLTCVSGQILFHRNESTKAEGIPPGNVAIWNSGIGTLVSVATDRPGQEDVSEALEVEQKLRDLRRAQRDVLPH